jgi:nucleotide-binding universal stress UspA family protein
VLTIDHIICPIDVSPSTRRLLAYAAVWARWYEAHLHVVHAVAPPELIGDPLGGIVMTGVRRPLHEVRAELTRVVSDVIAGDLRCGLDVIEGQPVDAILAAARQRPRSMLIMASHGRSGLDRLMNGSVTAAVTHHAPCAVLVLPANAAEHTEDIPLFRHVLCAVDFLPSSLAALQHALRLSEQAGARLEVVHVLETAGDENALGLRHFSVPEYHDARHQEALEELRRHIPERARRWCTIHERVATGNPGETLLRIADEAQADLIVMGSGDRFHLRSMWLGGATERVSRGAYAPVLIVPVPDASAEPPDTHEYD